MDDLLDSTRQTVLQLFGGDEVKAAEFLKDRQRKFEELQSTDAKLTNTPYQPNLSPEALRLQHQLQEEAAEGRLGRTLRRAEGLEPFNEAARKGRVSEIQGYQKLPVEVELEAIKSRERMFGRQNTTNMINNILRGAALFAL
jgi:hypothetical protein|tara:strand:- start:207 stop:632 length:426 start_codon:yes stop_codon:yes gene_type:complete